MDENWLRIEALLSDSHNSPGVGYSSWDREPTGMSAPERLRDEFKACPRRNTQLPANPLEENPVRPVLTERQATGIFP